MKRIGDILTRNKTPVVVEDGTSYKQVTIRTNYKGVVLRGTQNGSTILTKNQFVVSAGQFILSRIDARNGAFGIIPEELEGAIITNDFLAFDINEDEVEREFFNVFLQSPVFLEACIKASRGNTNRKRVDEDFFLNYQVNLPPLSDQHDLIKQINKGRTKIALAQHEIVHQQSLLAKLKQAILQEAIQGKLTADWRAAHPEVEPASQLLHRIQAEKARLIAAKKLRKEKPLPKITPAEIPFEIPQGWDWCVLEELSVFTNGKAHEQIVDPKGKYVLVNSRFVSTGGVTKKFARAILTPISIGDLAIVMSDVPDGRALGRCFLVDKDDHYTLNQRIGALRMLGQIVPMFAFLVLNRNHHFLSFNDGKKQTNLMKREILSCPFPLPPLAEQAAIVERVEGLMATCRALEVEIEHARTHAAHLLQAVLKEAFSKTS